VFGRDDDSFKRVEKMRRELRERKEKKKIRG
jgi:hypothetical protein